MPNRAIDAAVYSFEGLLPDLESPPIAARRALDHAGLRLSVESWRSVPLEDRERLTMAGMPERVDGDAVLALLRRASPAPQRISPVSDPDASAPPEALAKALEPTRAIDPKRWARLRAVDRYALAHTYRRAVARSAFSILGEAFDAVLAASAPAPAPAPPPPSQQPGHDAASASKPPPLNYQPAGFYSTVGATPVPPRAAAATTGAVAIGQMSTHLNQGGEIHMVDVARKPKTERRAVAAAQVRMRQETAALIARSEAPKGEVLATARVAAIMAAKRTGEIIPLCHSVALTHVEVKIEVDVAAACANVWVIAEAYDRTGVEMEAMVAASVACLTIYDMLKGVDRDMVVGEVKLLEKSGGRSGHYQRAELKP